MSFAWVGLLTIVLSSGQMRAMDSQMGLFNQVAALSPYLVNVGGGLFLGILAQFFSGAQSDQAVVDFPDYSHGLNVPDYTVQLSENITQQCYDYEQEFSVVQKESRLIEASLMDKISFFVALKSAINGNMEPLRALLDEGADVNFKTEYGRTALIWGVVEGNAQMVQLLLKAGASVNAVDDNGMSALKWAIVKYDAAAVKVLLDAGADTTAAKGDDETFLTYANVTALAFAAFYGNAKMVQILLEAGAKDDYVEEIACRQAIVRGHVAVAKLLLDGQLDEILSGDMDASDVVSFAKIAAFLYMSCHGLLEGIDICWKRCCRRVEPVSTD